MRITILDDYQDAVVNMQQDEKAKYFYSDFMMLSDSWTVSKFLMVTMSKY